MNGGNTGDLTVYAWIDVLVQGSFYPIFAMMFGYGMVIMQKRSKVKGVSFWKISVRRLSVLLLIGIFEAILHLVRGYIDYLCDNGATIIIVPKTVGTTSSWNRIPSIFVTAINHGRTASINIDF